MKTRNIFEDHDFEGSGQMIVRNDAPPGKLHADGAITICYKIGYIPEGRRTKVAMISLADGLVFTFSSIKKLCQHFNDDDIGYRPMTAEEISTVLGAQGNRF